MAADADILTPKLHEFAAQAKGAQGGGGLRPDLSAVMPLMNSSSSTAGTMPEGIALAEADARATNNVKTYFTTVDQGMLGWGATAGGIATRWDETDHRVAGGFQAAMVQQSGLPAVDERFPEAEAADRAQEGLPVEGPRLVPPVDVPPDLAPAVEGR